MCAMPLPGQMHITCNNWLAISKLSKIWSSWWSTYCDVITTCKYLSVHSAPDVLFTSSQRQSCSRGHVFFIWCKSPGSSRCKRIYSLSWLDHTWKENHKYDHIYIYIYIYTTNESNLVQHILKLRGRVHNSPIESIRFAISQPLCIMYISNIYIYIVIFMQIRHVSCILSSGCPSLFILNTRHNRWYIFCPGSYCKPRFIPTYVFMFWNHRENSPVTQTTT